MKFLLVRNIYNKQSTFGTLYMVKQIGVKFYTLKNFCNTLEPQWRDLKKEAKVRGETCIPAGRYKIVMSPSAKFKRNMPYLVDVPQFTGIMIHTGNYVEDTQGCILVGEQKNDMLVLSKDTFNRLYDLLSLDKENEIEIIDLKPQGL